MEYYNNLLCISGSELIGIITKDHYQKLVTRGSMRVLRRGCLNTPALIEWNSVPARIKQMYIAKHGDPSNTEGGYVLKTFIKTDYEAREWFANWKLPDGKNIPEEPGNRKQTEYCTNAELLNAINFIRNNQSSYIKTLGETPRWVWPQIVAQVKALKPSMKHTLPTSDTRLKIKLDKYLKEGYISIIKDRWNNNYAAKVDDIEQESTLRSLFRKHNNFDNEQIRRMYNSLAEQMGWDLLSAGSIANYRKKWALETYSGRRGVSAFENNKAMQVKRSAPTSPLYYWTVDGWDAELLYQDTFINDKGNTVTTYHNRLTAVVVLDPCCKYPIGYAIGTHETPELIKAALRNAINHTRDLFGSRHKVLQLQTDNYGKKKLLSIYEAISDYYTPARVHNAKAKVIEPWFKSINKDHCQYMPNWSGFGVTSGSSRQPNAEFLNKIRHSFPDEQGCRLQIEWILEKKRAEARDQYLAAYSKMPEQDKKIITDQEYLYLLGEVTGKTNRLQGSGLIVTINGEKREYDCFDPKFRQLSYVDWTVKYDPDQPESVLAINDDGSLRFSLSEKYLQPMALRERKEEDTIQLKRIRDYNQTMKEEITEKMAKDYQVVDDMFERNPQLNGTLAKLVLVDSTGQHKDNRNANRLKGAQKLLEKQTKAEERQQEVSWSQQQEDYLNSKIDVTKYLNMP